MQQQFHCASCCSRFRSLHRPHSRIPCNLISVCLPMEFDLARKCGSTFASSSFLPAKMPRLMDTVYKFTYKTIDISIKRNCKTSIIYISASNRRFSIPIGCKQIHFHQKQMMYDINVQANVDEMIALLLNCLLFIIFITAFHAAHWLWVRFCRGSICWKWQFSSLNGIRISVMPK